jgi:predicted nuclease of predicted toxin-antitoxin system
VKLLADVHISPATVAFLNELGYDAIRVSDALSPSSTERLIIAHAFAEERTVLTQDLDFSALMALSGQQKPSIITLHVASSRVEHVNLLLEKVLPAITQDVAAGSLITIEEMGIRTRLLPLL